MKLPSRWFLWLSLIVIVIASFVLFLIWSKQVNIPSKQTIAATAQTAIDKTIQTRDNPVVTRYLDIQAGKATSTGVEDSSDFLILKSYRDGTAAVSDKIEDPSKKGSYAFRVAVPFEIGEAQTYCGVYDSPLCAFVYEEPGKSLRIIGHVNENDENIIAFIPEGLIVSGSGGDAGVGSTGYRLINPKTGSSIEIGSVGFEADPMTDNVYFDVSASGTVLQISDMAASGTYPEQLIFGDPPHVLKTIQLKNSLDSITLDPVETLHHPGKIYFTADKSYIYDATVKPPKLIQL